MLALLGAHHILHVSRIRAKNTKLDLIQSVFHHVKHFRTNGWLEMGDYDARQPQLTGTERRACLKGTERTPLPLCRFRDRQYLQKVEETSQPDIERLMQNNLDMH